jgi:hypothetical protein
MSLKKIENCVVERIAPARGPTSSSDYNATQEEIRDALIQITNAWNNELQPLLDTLPGGFTGIDPDKRVDNPNPFVNGFDGSQLYTDIVSTETTDDGRFYNTTKKRPYTIKETFNNIQRQLNDEIQNIEVEIAKIANESAITARQKQMIGSRIFDPGTDSVPSSLDGMINDQYKNINQISLDLSGKQDYLQNSGSMTLMYSVFDQLKEIQKAHDYDVNFNKMTHKHLEFHDHRWHVIPNGAMNGENRDYYLPGDEIFIAGSLQVVLNGTMLVKDLHYEEFPNCKGFKILEHVPALVDSKSGIDALEDDEVGSNDLLRIHYTVSISQ